MDGTDGPLLKPISCMIGTSPLLKVGTRERGWAANHLLCHSISSLVGGCFGGPRISEESVLHVTSLIKLSRRHLAELLVSSVVSIHRWWIRRASIHREVQLVHCLVAWRWCSQHRGDHCHWVLILHLGGCHYGDLSCSWGPPEVTIGAQERATWQSDCWRVRLWTPPISCPLWCHNHAWRSGTASTSTGQARRCPSHWTAHRA